MTVLATGGELLVELINAAGGVDEALLTRVGRVGGSGDIATDDEVLHAVDHLGFLGTEGGMGGVLQVGGDVDEHHGMVFGMTFGLHKREGWLRGKADGISLGGP